MKIKINWGTAMVIVMSAFMIFILQYVYRASVFEKYRHHLVAEDYYKDELNYQLDINKEKASNKLTENLKLIKTNTGLALIFPSSFNFKEISGKIKLLRPSNYKLDLEKNLKLTSNTFLIKKSDLVAGKYKISIDWQYKSKSYLYKKSYIY